MTRVDFYLGAPNKIDVACRIVQKALQQKLRVLVFAPDAATHERIDRQLWLAPPTGFVPHCSDRAPIAAETPVLIARAPVDPPPHDQVLVNLDDAVAPHFARFERVVEIVSQAEDDKALARQRFRFYKDRGYALHTHELGQG